MWFMIQLRSDLDVGQRADSFSLLVFFHDVSFTTGSALEELHVLSQYGFLSKILCFFSPPSFCPYWLKWFIVRHFLWQKCGEVLVSLRNWTHEKSCLCCLTVKTNVFISCHWAQSAQVDPHTHPGTHKRECAHMRRALWLDQKEKAWKHERRKEAAAWQRRPLQ